MYEKLLKEFENVFSCRHEDLKVYNKIFIQNIISLKEIEKPFKHKLRRISPKMFLLIQKEVRTPL